MLNTKIIAEAGVNHNGDIDLAMELIDIAKSSDCDFVKFQTFKAAKLASPETSLASYQSHLAFSSQYQMLKLLELTYQDFKKLSIYCNKVGINFLSTPFDFESAQFLVEEIGMKCIKIPSGEVSNIPYLLELGSLKTDYILSTGMCNLSDIELALGALACGYLNLEISSRHDFFASILNSNEARNFITNRVTILHCTTEYPAPLESVNLLAMKTIGNAFNVKYGISDHTDGVEVPIGAVALGATIVEKHFTKSKDMIGPDHKASLDPQELSLMVRMIRNIELALGQRHKYSTPSEEKNKAAARKVIVASTPIKKGDKFDSSNLTIMRASMGVLPRFYWSLLSERASKDYTTNEAIIINGLM